MKRLFHLFCLFLLLGGMLACRTKVVTPTKIPEGEPQHTIQELSAQELFKKILERDAARKNNEAEEIATEDFILLDVRDEYEYKDGHVSGAILIPWTQLRSRQKELDPTKEIVVYCRSGNRSSIASTILIHNKFNKIVTMPGGIMEWQRKGYPLVKGMQPYAPQK